MWGRAQRRFEIEDIPQPCAVVRVLEGVLPSPEQALFHVKRVRTPRVAGLEIGLSRARCGVDPSLSAPRGAALGPFRWQRMRAGMSQ